MPVDRAEFRRLHEDEGWGVTRLASHFRIGQRTARDIRQELGLTPKPGARTARDEPSDADLDAACLEMRRHTTALIRAENRRRKLAGGVVPAEIEA